MLDGPRIASRSGATRHLVVFLHGYGADGNDLIDLGRVWQDVLPADTAFVSPHAPEPCAGASYGRQWFALTFRDPGERWRGVEQARPALDAFLDAEMARHGVAAANVALVGFSQGTMMALHAGLRRKEAPGGIIGYSGMLVVPPGQGPESLALSPQPAPVLLVHGDQDGVIPPEALDFSAKALASQGVAVRQHMSPRLGHGIDQDGLKLGAIFLTEAFAAAPKAGA